MTIKTDTEKTRESADRESVVVGESFQSCWPAPEATKRPIFHQMFNEMNTVKGRLARRGGA